MVRSALLLFVLAALNPPILPQPLPPNDAGVTMGHLHLNVPSLEPHRRFWDALGGRHTVLGTIEGRSFRGVTVYFRNVAPSSGNDGTVIGHIGLVVKDLAATLARAKAAGFASTREEGQSAQQAFLSAPDGLKVELTEDPSLDVSVAHHHIHFYMQKVADAQAWYAKVFGAVPGRRGKFEAADIPGANLTFSESAQPTAPTRGHTLDHIGIQVRGLEEFAKKLEAAGIKLDVPYRQVTNLGIALVFLTDPWGTYIELTEPLSPAPGATR